ncbi:MAG: excinuclease ABC subunit UvrA, partial [Candidatus Bathyarchaeia archaeon]
MDKIIIRGARQHNLKNIDVVIPKNRLVVITGPSGSGKSSLAFDTIYAEGQRRYVESLSSYARQFLELMDKPDVDSIEGLSPAISIEQKSLSKNPRSTVGTVTEIYDYLRLLFARVGRVYCFSCGKEIKSQHTPQIVETILSFPEGTEITIYAPIVRGRKGEYRKELDELRRQGFIRVRIDGIIYDLQEEIVLDKNKKHEIDLFIDKVSLREGAERRLYESIELALSKAQGIVKIEIGDETHLFSESFACPECGISYPEITPRMFSFNNPYGACPDCLGLGVKEYFDPSLIIPNPDLSIREGAILPWAEKNPMSIFPLLESLVDHMKVDIRKPFRELPEDIKRLILFGSGGKPIPQYIERGGKRELVMRPYEGVIGELRREWEISDPWERQRLERFINLVPCPTCGGARLKKEMLWVKIGGLNIHEVTKMTISQAANFFRNLDLTEKEREIAKLILKEINSRLQFLLDVGLDYITLDRASTTLSSGEAQRIRLATQIGSGLTGVLYVLDEPSIGLHQRDNERLIKTLMRLRNLGNTVIVVEHDYETIVQADYVVDLGPGAGENGGYLVFQGRPEDLALNERSLTGKYLSGKLRIEVPQKRRRPKGFITIKGARANNLKNIDVKIPLGVFTCITGVSGSGK